ncbi:MAG: membrane protein [Thermonema sp.]|uniref:TolC family protein n=1 Tax=Thermonema sp. TaxID=2231181 RepID=UPI0021DC11ED|nr:TolC family protein [Thermonema sp.]GIV40269.1 MAG: membrane protein [Thermonema sp.]
MKQLHVLFLLCLQLSAAQAQSLVMGLQEAIERAQTQSLDYEKNRNEWINNYWAYKTYQAGLRPRLVFRGDLPDLSRTIVPVIQNDGTETFRARSLANSFAEMALEQPIVPTGGTFFVSSQLSRIDVLSPVNTTSYLAYPVVVGIRQPLWGYNHLLWQQRIEPLRYEESRRRFDESMEMIAVKTTELFFNALLAQKNLEIADFNYSNADTLYSIARARFELGKISEVDLLEIELYYLNNRNARDLAQYEYNYHLLQLKNYLRLGEDTDLQLKVPEWLPLLRIDATEALAQARQNRAKTLSIQRRLLEAEQEVAKARAERGVRADLYLSFGLSKSAPTLQDTYSDVQDQERFRLSLEIPILDWGRGRARIKTALANYRLTQTEAEIEQSEFEQEVLLQVQRWNIYSEQIQYAQRAWEVARKRYEIAWHRFRRGHIQLSELNAAKREQNEAQRQYLSSLQNLWSAYFVLRMLTLYDFEKQQTIEYEIHEEE